MSPLFIRHVRTDGQSSRRLSETLRLWLVLVLFIPLAAGAAAPLRLAVQPAPYVSGPVAGEVTSVCLSLYLYERLSEIPSVCLASEGWTSAALSEIYSSKRSMKEDAFFSAFAAEVPVDAALTYQPGPDKFTLFLHRKDGVRQHAIPCMGADAKDVVLAAARWLAEELKLSPQETAVLMEDRIPEKNLFQACYLSQRVYATWPNNPGEARIKVLQPFFMGTESAPLAGQILICAERLLAATSRDQTFAGGAVTMSHIALPRVLGTPYESSAWPLLKLRPAEYQAELLSMVEPLSEVVIDLDALGRNAMDEQIAENASPVGAKTALSPEQRVGALRALGVSGSMPGLKIILQLAGNDDAKIRQAVAFALEHYAGTNGMAALKKLAADKDSATAFSAACSLWKRGETSPRQAELARSVLATAARPQRPLAAQLLAAVATPADAPVFAGLLQDPDGSIRALAAKTLLGFDAIDLKGFTALLRDPDDQVVLTALPHLQPKFAASEEVLGLGRNLANDVLGTIAQASRQALIPSRPKSERERMLFDLAVEHTYIRNEIVDALAAGTDEWSLTELRNACSNSIPQTRAHALKRLLDRSPERAHPPLVAAISDSFRWVRLHAAAMLAPLAAPTDAGAIKAAIAGETDAAIRLYLEDALAKAEGRPMPPPRPAVHSIQGRTNLAWACGAGLDCAKSPFDAHYCLSPDLPEAARRAHEAGKIFFPRVNTVGNPGTIITTPSAMDNFWLTIEGEVTTNNLPFIDGFVFGEETMSMDPGGLWADGWPLFCRDAGIDPARVSGVRSNLNRYETGAWNYWAETKLIDGFNTLYDYVKLRYGKLRPGMQVGTFLPGQSGSIIADRQWKFDLGGVYDYKGDNRIAAYDLIRRYKTLWPDRPVLWLSLGIGGYEMNPVRYNQKTPTEPLDWRWDRAYADSVCAWLAGADTGWFSTWIFVDRKFAGDMHHLKGVQILIEDITTNSPMLQSGIEYAFAGVEKEYNRLAEPPPPGQPEGDLTFEPTTEKVTIDIDDKATTEERKIAARVKEEKRLMRNGFLFYGKYVYDNARAFASLPRMQSAPPVLAVHPGLSVWSRGGEFNTAGENLLNAYDFLADVNQVPQFDLSRYRLIVLGALNGAPLMDETIGAISTWLKNAPGLLYIHGDLSRDNANQASTTANYTGVLTNDWPWEKDIVFEGNHYELKSAAAESLATDSNGVSLASWQGPGFAGAVLFDCRNGPDTNYMARVRSVVNDLNAKKKIGVAMNGPIRQVVGQMDEITGAAASSGFSEPRTYPGVDLLTGEPNPSVGGGRSGMLTATELSGKYAACMNGVDVLCDQPLEEATKIEGGLRVRSAGLIRAGSGAGRVTVKSASGGALPKIEKAADWLLFGSEEGMAMFAVNGTNNFATYIRSKQPVSITRP